MSVLAGIGRELEKKLITAILPAGRGQKLVAALAEMPGVLSISRHHARGVGGRRIRDGQLYFDEKDVLILLVETEFVDEIFSSLFHEARLNQPGAGMIFMEKVLRGHPMMPFEGADW